MRNKAFGFYKIPIIGGSDFGNKLKQLKISICDIQLRVTYVFLGTVTVNSTGLEKEFAYAGLKKVQRSEWYAYLTIPMFSRYTSRQKSLSNEAI
ncbi:hypothetical protein PPL_04239 [Heterostelium album PN500]|uniref:Uncharacterized protein n=1 Tax=Heterostelium pallidum (strain ATCC 26659 / Pp 5 / PN500) TaxID=670386 RepID=D3B708_HETP5|nr:hypothetical protein PPL_04239 [Heterostelium album PN500]EFA82551.1 hypothetical protein PPL_04239 [Heterostelium album PN500]|eukprot:XP_020434668.1 hypothetical protein PPL_04239 [Heterostelium album PN500]